MILKWDIRDLESFGKGLTDMLTEIEKAATEVLLRHGNRVADDIVDSIRRGVDLSGGVLKPNTKRAARRKARKKGLMPAGFKGDPRELVRPLIDTGILIDRGRWQIKTRRSRKGELSVSIGPSADRARVFYAYLPSKGYNKSQGIRKELAKQFTNEMGTMVSELLKRHIE